MLSNSSTRISSQYHQVKAGGDPAAMMGIAKALFAIDDEITGDNPKGLIDKALALFSYDGSGGNGKRGVIDRQFIAEHTHGFDDFEKAVRSCPWERIERFGLTRNALEAAAAVYARCHAVTTGSAVSLAAAWWCSCTTTTSIA